MRAITFDVSVPRFILARTIGSRVRSAVFGGLSGVRLRELPIPELPGPEWVRIRVTYGGVCGTDIGNLRYRASPAMEPFGSFPAVLGHEILGVVEAVGARAGSVETGQRVAVDPIISCTVRGYGEDEACPSCHSGLSGTCEEAGEEGPLRLGDEFLARGFWLGYHRQLPGAWGEYVVAHRSQIFPVPDQLEDRTAALTEPLSIGVHAVLGAEVPPGGTVLVIGSGPIAFATIWALRATGFRGTLVSQAKRRHEAEIARALGATDVVEPADARDALIETGAKAYQPIVGPEVYAGGGFPLIFDCVGSRATLSQSIRYAAPRGRIVILGCAAEIKKLDLTFMWARELEAKGFVGYGRERWQDGWKHTFEITHALMLESSAPLDRLVTHVFPLGQYGDALRAADDHRVSGAIKVLLKP